MNASNSEPRVGTTGVDVTVIGSGSGGKMVAQQLAQAGRSVVLVEAGLVGGYCPYLACVPAKSLLLSARAKLSWVAARAVRDEVSSHRDDADAAQQLAKDGVVILRGRGRLSGPGRVVVDLADGGIHMVQTDVVVVGTGSAAVSPPVDGLDEVPTWTSEQALSTTDLPARLVVIGGGAVACESAQAFAGLGSTVTQLVRGSHVLSGEPAWVGGTLGDALRADGVDVRTGVQATSARRDGDGGVLTLNDGSQLSFDRLLLAVGRVPVTDGLGLKQQWLDSGAVRVNARCRVIDADGAVVPGLFAVGDVTGISKYTHSANHQARTVVGELLGRGQDADYSAIPRAVYTHPAVFSLGDTSSEGTISARFDIDDVERAALLRLSTGARTPGGVELFADSDGVLVGAACVGPDADSWGSELALAVRARLKVNLMIHHVRAFPTWSEVVFPALEQLQRILAEQSARRIEQQT